MKKMAVAIACTAALAAGSASAQIPTTDLAAITEQANQHMEEIGKWAEQLTSMTNQLTQMKQQYEAVTGSRNLGDIFNNPELRNYLPQEWQAVYDSVNSGGYGGLSNRGQQIYNQNKIYDACQSIIDQDSRTSCEAMAVRPSQDKANALTAFDAAKSRLNQINQLMGQINGTTDPKAIGELQARIASEQAMIANSQTEMQLYAMVAEAEAKMQEQRQREINARDAARKEYAPLRPLTFSN